MTSVSDIYIPSMEQWLKYYKNLIHHKNEKGGQIGGSIVVQSSGPMNMIDEIQPGNKPSEKTKTLSVDLVSPVQQNTDQVKEGLQREIQIKRKYKKVKPKRKSVKKTDKKNSKSRKKINKSCKKSTQCKKKKRSKDIFD